MTKTSPRSKPTAAKSLPTALQHLRPADLRAAVQMAGAATLAIQQITEGVHQAVLGTLGQSPGRAPGRTGGLTGQIYRSIAGVTRVVAGGADAALSKLQPWLDKVAPATAATPQRELALAVLNGVIGDQLHAQASPWATPMTLLWQGAALTPTNPWRGPTEGRKVVVLVHGLCVNERIWYPADHDQTAATPTTAACDLGTYLAQAAGYSPLYLRYNTGRHISDNGRDLALQLEQLLAHWPCVIDDLSVIGYSMGGLLLRSALDQAQTQGMAWPKLLKNMLFLATPHHGSPLERAGHWLDVILGSNAFSAPWGQLARLRSAGITDLRYGLIREPDWLGRDRFRRHPDQRQPVPLPQGVQCYALAACSAARRGPLADRLTGDGLVPLHSALGVHDQPTLSLAFAKTHQHIVFRTHHLAVPTDAAVQQQVLRWLSGRVPS